LRPLVFLFPLLMFFFFGTTSIALFFPSPICPLYSLSSSPAEDGIRDEVGLWGVFSFFVVFFFFFFFFFFLCVLFLWCCGGVLFVFGFFFFLLGFFFFFVFFFLDGCLLWFGFVFWFFFGVVCVLLR